MTMFVELRSDIMKEFKTTGTPLPGDLQGYVPLYITQTDTLVRGLQPPEIGEEILLNGKEVKVLDRKDLAITRPAFDFAIKVEDVL